MRSDAVIRALTGTRRRRQTRRMLRGVATLLRGLDRIQRYELGCLKRRMTHVERRLGLVA